MMRFLAAKVEGPLAQRCQKAYRMARTEIEPGPIEVTPASESAEGDPLHVEPTLLGSVPLIDPDMLKELAATAGGADEGLETEQQLTLSKVMQGVLHSLEANSTNPAALRRALDALERPFIELKLTPVDDCCSASHDYQCEAWNAERDDELAVGDLGKMLERLQEGEHLYLRVTHEIREKAHVLAISATRLPGDQVQLSLFNPNGWRLIARSDTHARFPAIGKTVSHGDARAALDSLAGGIIELPTAMRGRVSPLWHNLSAGAPLSTWLRAVDPESKLQPTSQQMTPQKCSDCGIEVEFAWLASVLPEADYKLAKANLLNILTQAAVYHALDESVVERLRERVTSSLSAHAMAADLR